MGSEHAAVYVPARSMIQSGRSLFHLNGPGGMTTDHPTLPEAFGNAGYRTFGTGKWHNGHEAFNRCYDEGTDVFFGAMGNHRNVPVTDRYSLGEYPDDRPNRFLPGDERGPQPVRQTYERYASGIHSSELFADATIRFLRSHQFSADNRPFFAYTAFIAPHDPRTALGEYHAMYKPHEIELPENFREEHPFDNGYLRTRDENLDTRRRDPDEVRRHIAGYYAMITHLDAHVGRILRTLERTGERGNTLVVFTADHGLAVGQHGLLGKQNVYDHSIRVPLVFRGPGVPVGEQREVFSYHHDLNPTLAEFADLSVPDTVDGESLLQVIDGADTVARESVFSAFGETQRAVRTDRYKLVEYDVAGDHHTQLFDLRADPAETQNLTGDADVEGALERLRDELADWRERVDDPTVTD